MANITNITIQWDRLDCQDRNGQIGGYRIVYSSSAAPSTIIDAQRISGTEDSDRIFTATGLLPRSSYIFQVQANNVRLDVHGAAGSSNVSTTAPQGITHVFQRVVTETFYGSFSRLRLSLC